MKIFERFDLCQEEKRMYILSPVKIKQGIEIKIPYFEKLSFYG